jgi:hypothetical protein
MKRLLVTAATILLFATMANAQTEQQKRDFISACLAGAIKTGCPPQPTQTPDISGRPSIPIEQIRARNTAAAIQADNDAAKFSTGAAPAATKPQSPFSIVTVSPAPAQAPAVQDTYVNETAPETPITPKPAFIMPSRRHNSAACGPATPPPGSGWLYGVNRARCLRTAR